MMKFEEVCAYLREVADCEGIRTDELSSLVDRLERIERAAHAWGSFEMTPTEALEKIAGVVYGLAECYTPSEHGGWPVFTEEPDPP